MTLVAMHLSGAVTEIWHLKDNGVANLTSLESRDIIGHVTIWLPGVDFLCVVYSDLVSI